MRRPTTSLLAGVCGAAALLCLVGAGASNGEDASATAPKASAPASVVPPADYRVAVEDVLRVDVWGEPQLSNLQMQVTPDGKANFPYIGALTAEGQTLAELTSTVAGKLEEMQILVHPKVQITLMNMHQPTAWVLGQVNRPGAITFKDGDTILEAVAQAGSYTSEALLEKSTLTHKGSDKTVPLDLKKLFAGDLTQNYPLIKGDTIYIPPTDYERKIYVLGQVNRPGVYDLKDNTKVLSALSFAQGPSERGSIRGTVVVRGTPEKAERVPCDLSKLLDKADLSQDILLQPGDVVMVPETKKPNWNKISQLLSTISSFSYIRRYGLF